MEERRRHAPYPSGDPATLVPPLVPGTRSLRALLPESYRQGDFADRFISGFDDTLAPLITTLDCLDGYFSARTAPDDLVDWMLGWTGTSLPRCVGPTGRRNALLLGHRLHGLRGTGGGLDLLVRHVLGGRLELSESGGTHHSSGPGGAPVPGPARVRVRVLLPHGTSAGRPGVTKDVEDLLREWIPAHVAAEITVADDADPLLAGGGAGGAR
ncbi:phage tail protein [Streptomyces lavendulae]|uniref:phage tail protein n=1 Tax=Streptomyces lavendulae TaxID=1914 RepID=UPI00380061C6